MRSLLALAAALMLAAAPALAQQQGRIMQKPAAQPAAPAKKGVGAGQGAFQPSVLPGPPRADQMGTLGRPGAGQQTKGFNPGLKPLYGVGPGSRAPTRR